MNVVNFNSRDDMLKSIRKSYVILYPDGNEVGFNPENPEGSLIKLTNVEDDPLQKYIKSEELGYGSHSRPASIDAMRKLELVDYEPASDAGHFRFYPEGSMIFDLLVEWANEIAIEKFGAMKIETPLIYDWHQKDIREQGESFHERHYVVKVSDDPDKEWVLRFAGDFGLFRMMKDAKISYRNLPMRVYELSKSFRYERRGELTGLKRLRGFTMPDIHSFTRNLDEGWEEYIELYKHYDDLAKNTEIEYAIVFRVVREFYEANKPKILEMLRYSNRPALIELLSGMKHYWVIKHEFQGIDTTGGACQLSTVQLDVVDSLRYGITYTDNAGEEKGCVICHSSVGSIERWIHMILESSLQKVHPTLPLWLSPTQIRIIPVKNDYLESSISLYREFKKAGLRCDIDDREMTMQKKVMSAQKKWIPVMIVLGEKEVQSGELSVTLRERGETIHIKKEELIERMLAPIEEKPRIPSNLPFLLSRKPKFYG